MKRLLYLAVCVCWVLCAGAPCSAASEKWQTLTNCVLLANRANDGDSFHVKHAGREYIFRLCFVDTPETSLTVEQRVVEQAAYWGISVTAAVAVGEQATAFTADFLSSGFTVYTRFDDAKGASRLPRYFAFIVVKGKHLSEALVAQGLARVYGYQPNLPDGADRRKYRAHLLQIEADAKRAGRGAWGVKKA